MKIYLFIIGLFFVQNIFGQEVILTTGETKSTNIGEMSYSIGQTIYNQSDNLQNGIQQPIEIFKFVSILDYENIEINIYPNPIIDYLNIEISNSNLKQYNISLFDLNGKLISEMNNISLINKINFSNYNQNIYFLKIFRNNENIKTIKIIKL
jgi:hypothetical protein